MFVNYLGPPLVRASGHKLISPWSVDARHGSTFIVSHDLSFKLFDTLNKTTKTKTAIRLVVTLDAIVKPEVDYKRHVT